MSDIDRFDVSILKLLQVNSRITSEAIGEAVGLSPSACQRRIKRLRECGVIGSEIAVLDPQVVGGRITLVVQVELERGGAHVIDAFKREMLEVPEIQQCFYVTGGSDFVLIVTARDMTDYEQLTRRVFFDNRNIRRFHTIVVMETVKSSLQIPL